MTHRSALLLACSPEQRQRARWVLGTWAARYDVELNPIDRLGDAPDDRHLIVYGDLTDRARSALHITCDPTLADGTQTPSGVCWVDHRGEPVLDLSGKSHAPLIATADEGRSVHLGLDVVTSAFLFLSGASERNVARLDRHGRVPHDETLVGRLGLTHQPVVDGWFGLLADALGTLVGVPVDRRDLWHGAPFAVCLTHDIDRIHRGWVDASRRALRLAGDGRTGSALGTAGAVLRGLASGSDLYWNLDELLAIDRRYGGSSTFYLMADVSHPLDADYRLSGRPWERAIRRIRQAGGEIGLHGSYTSYRTPAQLSRQREIVERLAGEPVVGVRQHFLRFDPARTWTAQAQAGFRHDSTFGFVEEVGFRAGTSFPYQAYDLAAGQPLPLVELPLLVMDRTLEGYLRLTPDAAWNAAEPILNAVRRSGGCLVVLWHNLFVAGACYPGWRGLYERILDWAQTHRSRFVTGAELAGAVTAASR